MGPAVKLEWGLRLWGGYQVSVNFLMVLVAQSLGGNVLAPRTHALARSVPMGVAASAAYCPPLRSGLWSGSQ